MLIPVIEKEEGGNESLSATWSYSGDRAAIRGVAHNESLQEDNIQGHMNTCENKADTTI